MEVVTTEYHTGSSWIEIEIPKHCPNCGIGNNPENKCVAAIDECAVYSHYCTPCKKFHYSVQDKMKDNKRELLLVYPNAVIADIDSLLIEHAPNFTTVYSEAIQAEKSDMLNIAGMGYRLSIECLIKDYALDFGLGTEEDISKLNFNNAIDKFMKDDELLKNSIHTVRKIGNDYSHWKKEYDIPLNVLKAYVDIVIQSFKVKFMMKYPPV